MLKNARPSEHFLGALLRAYDRELASEGRVTCSGIWDGIVIECMRSPIGSFDLMFEWDKSKAQRKNRIGTIAETIRRGHVPGLSLDTDERGREIVVRR